VAEGDVGMNNLTVAADSLRRVIRKTWWVPLLQGIAALIIGLMLVARPGATLVVLTIFLGAYWLVGGIFDIVGAFSRQDADRHWVFALVGGILSAAVGLLLLGQPILGAIATSFALVSLLALGAILSGVFDIAWAVRVRNEIQGEGWIILLGLLSVLLGLALLASPLLSIVALVQVAALLAIVGGIALIITAFRLRSAAG
jgi:uncharacterized membrane protein HdeD (DUF308 family)